MKDVDLNNPDMSNRIARFKRPKDVVFVEALPRNALGKIVAADVRALL